jgi:hypothetical protein
MTIISIVGNQIAKTIPNRLNENLRDQITFDWKNVMSLENSFERP